MTECRHDYVKTSGPLFSYLAYECRHCEAEIPEVAYLEIMALRAELEELRLLVAGFGKPVIKS